MKTCRKCGKTKTVFEFDRCWHGKYLKGECRDCVRKRNKAYLDARKQDPNWVARERERCRKKLKQAKENGTLRQPSKEVQRRYYLNHRHKALARAKARQAVKDGLISKPTICDRCNRLRTLQAHHEDYSKPLEVIWLCSRCHGITRRKPFGAPIERKAA